ncbi:MAG: Sapep family Mn(2+)-dependent dipeptidase, partial [Clostridiales bacterium]
VRINSVEGAAEEGKPFGSGPAEALAQVLSIANEMGFKTENMDNYIGFAEWGEGKEILAILVHMDVVPVGDGWSMNPFCGEVIGNRLYGRGSYDDKGGAVAAIYALKAVKDSGAKFHKRVRIIFGTNEETGMNDIDHYLQREGQPDMAFSPDSPFPAVFGEKGVLDFDITYPVGKMTHIRSFQGGDNRKFTPNACIVTMAVNDEEKAFLLKKLAAFTKFESSYEETEQGMLSILIKGKRIFAVCPQDGKNAATGMIDFLSGVDFLADEIGAFCNYYMEKLGYCYDASTIGCDVNDTISTPLTLSPDIFQLQGDKMIFSVHCRFPVTGICDEIVAKLSKALTTNKASVEFVRVSPAHYVSKESKLVSTLMNVYRRITGDTDAQPVTMEGGTYARTMNNAVAFGPLFPGEPQVAHCPDEFVNLDSLIKAAKIYAHAIYELCCE